jgi:hypothetical protein
MKHRLKQVHQLKITDMFSLKKREVAIQTSPGMFVAPEASRKLRKISQTRWSYIMRRVRVLNGMEAVLGPRHWKRFVEYAKRTHYRQFLARFRTADHYLVCDGGGESRPCPVRFKVGTATEEGLHELRWLHLDHNTDLKLVCEKWRTTHDPKSKRWSGAFKKRHLVSFLFEDLQFRCHLPTMQPRERCHRTDLPHYRPGKKMPV